MNVLRDNLSKIMRLCMETMHDTARRMDKASVEIPELAEQAKELRAAAETMENWIEGIKP